MKKQSKELKGQVALLYNENGCRAFAVKCYLGNFKVVDYQPDPLDREVYWDNETHNQINKSAEEYEVAGLLVDGYVDGVYNKLTPEDRKRWPLTYRE
jgi:hypothetical protein